jgi:hypothetical protein
MNLNSLSSARTLLAAALAVLFACFVPRADGITPAEARAIAKEAYVFGFPMVDSRIQAAVQNPR